MAQFACSGLTFWSNDSLDEENLFSNCKVCRATAGMPCMPWLISNQQILSDFSLDGLFCCHRDIQQIFWLSKFDPKNVPVSTVLLMGPFNAPVGIDRQNGQCESVCKLIYPLLGCVNESIGERFVGLWPTVHVVMWCDLLWGKGSQCYDSLDPHWSRSAYVCVYCLWISFTAALVAAAAAQSPCMDYAITVIMCLVITSWIQSRWKRTLN